MISLAYILLYLFCDRTLPFSDEFFSEDQSESAKEYLKENLKFKKKYPIQKMAESTKIEGIIKFCKIVDEMDPFAKPDYKQLFRVLKCCNYDYSYNCSSQIRIPVFPHHRLMNHA